MHKLLAGMLIIGITNIGIAKAESWQTFGSDKDAMGGDMRVIEIDLDSIKSTAAETIVKARISHNSIGNEGYNCSEGELRHGNLDKKIAKMICDKPSSANPYGDHEADWQTVRVAKVKKGELITKFDLNSISRIKDEVMVKEMISDISKTTFHFDCKGYFKTPGNQWETLDLTDHIPTVPRGFVSLERKLENKVCHGANHEN